jgi:ABC-type Fe3+-hydroxamate transport system substrate-binding protein
MKHILILVTLLVSVVLSVTSVATESTKTHQGRGVITAIDTANDMVYIDQEPIKSLN